MLSCIVMSYLVLSRAVLSCLLLIYTVFVLLCYWLVLFLSCLSAMASVPKRRYDSQDYWEDRFVVLSCFFLFAVLSQLAVMIFCLCLVCLRLCLCLVSTLSASCVILVFSFLPVCLCVHVEFQHSFEQVWKVVCFGCLFWLPVYLSALSMLCLCILFRA
jgi:hypothetical protein